jgi:mercuric reductase
MTTMYDVVVLGAGTAGINAAHAAADAGARTLLVNDGAPVTACAAKNCMPSKALLAATHVAHRARNAAPFGVHVQGEVVADFSSMVAQVNEQVRLFTRSVEQGVRQAVDAGTFDFLVGRAAFVPGGGVAVNGQRFAARRYVIATGSVPLIPSIEGLDSVPYFTSDGVLELEEAPRSLVIIGAGPVGLEFAEVFARVGTDVLLVERGTLLPDFDPEFGEEFARYFEAEPHLTVHTSAQVTRVRQGEQGRGLRVTIGSGERTWEHDTEHLMVATGRRPALDGLGLEHVGLEPEHGTLKVNTAMQTANLDVFWLAGDVVGPQILHIAAEEGRVAGHNAAVGWGERTMDYARQDLVVIFTSLAATRTGLTASQAEAAGFDVVTASDNPAASGRGITDKDAFGLWKLVADKTSGRILGAQILETHADASIHLAKMALNAGLTVGDLSQMVVYHPTRAERLKGLAHSICRHIGAQSGATMCPQ